MATIKLTITVGKLSNVLTLFDQMKVYRSTAGAGGPYVEITGVGTRIALVAGQTIYTYDDTAGDPTYYYKTSYYNSVSTLESSLSEPIQGDADSLYISVQDLRDEGIPATKLPDDLALERILTWQGIVERITRNWFTAREMTWEFNGNGTRLLQFPVPIISVTSLAIDGEEIEASDFRAYTGRGGGEPDHRKNPRIRLISGETSVFEGTGSVRKRGVVFRVGELNVEVAGSFGYVEPDGSTPAPIVYAMKKLVANNPSKLGLSSGGASGPVIEEETDRHRKKWSDPLVGSKMWSSTGDPEVDQILACFKAPLAMGAPRTVFKRFAYGRVLL